MCCLGPQGIGGEGMTTVTKFAIGDRVRKIDGDVRFEGVVRTSYLTISGKPRMVVECTIPGVEGLQHIYRPEQFALEAKK